MALSQSLGIVPLFIVGNCARYGIMAPPHFQCFARNAVWPTDLFLPILANLFLIMLILMVKGLSE
jgi:hypothetical protein